MFIYPPKMREKREQLVKLASIGKSISLMTGVRMWLRERWESRLLRAIG